MEATPLQSGAHRPPRLGPSMMLEVTQDGADVLAARFVN